jgi:hypothetical protein
MNFNQKWNNKEYENKIFCNIYKLKKCKIQGKQEMEKKEEAKKKTKYKDWGNVCSIVWVSWANVEEGAQITGKQKKSNMLFFTTPTYVSSHTIFISVLCYISFNK